MVGSLLNTQVAYAIVLCRPSEPWTATLIPILQVGKQLPREKSSRAEVTSLGDGRAALSPACYFTAFLRPMLLTNSASQHWAPSAGLSPYQRLKATQGTCPAMSLFHRGRTSAQRAHAVLCCGVWSQKWALPHHPVDVTRVSVTPLWTHVWQITDTLLRTTLICLSVMRTGICYTFSFPDFRPSRYQSVDSQSWALCV